MTKTSIAPNICSKNLLFEASRFFISAYFNISLGYVAPMKGQAMLRSRKS
jgi:hypothetical protein